ncbi:hypothetical protein, variant 1 [Aphanomyces invadans]|uniref:Golgin-84 n=1 Tax=Aphanomyces invadans TaxID=157072 RepID=A0A024UI41_9STRA|nr:hypothetical protein, variant 1 [Aphanomyces invadans]ETW05929.1 hypothetical protein, variant 1 [Aphanomyces invadans]|eukprot:XP_008865706.1 hypothetical protein, variant 1 [Aphanomyces invadans]
MMREFRRFLFREKMSWLSSSLQLAGELLESVDQKASGKLKPRGEDRKKPKTVSEEAWEVKHTSSGGYEDSTHHNLHVSTEFETPSHSSSSAHQAAPASPSNGGPDADSFSEWSEVDNESNSGLVMYDEPPLSSSSSKSHQLPPLPAEMQSMKSETQRLRRENAKLRNDLSSVERQLTNSTEQLSVCQEELEALDKECMDKIKCLEQQIAQMGREKAADEAQFVAALGVKDAHVHTLEADLASYKQLVQEHVAEAAKLKQSIEELTNTREEAWTHAASGEAQLLQQVASLQEELKDAAVAHAQLKKEYADAKQSMYARQCTLEATNAELTTLVAKREHSAKPSAPSPTHAHRALQEAQETLASTKKLLHEECRKAMLQAQEIHKLTGDMAALQTMLVQKEASHHATVLNLQQQLQDRAALQSKPTPSVPLMAAVAPDGQMQAMTRRLLEKQEQLDALRGRYTTLEVRFNDLKAAKDAQDKNDDLELSVRSVRTPRGGNYHGRPRPAPHKVAALEAVDRWLLSVGRFLRAYPEARLALLGYLVLLHLWAFVILGFHTSHLNEEVKAKTAP